MYSHQLKSLVFELIAQEPLLKPVFSTITIDEIGTVADKAIEIANRQGYLDDRVSKPRSVNTASHFIAERDKNGA